MRIPRRTFSEAEAAGDFLQLRVRGEEFLELWRFRLQFELARGPGLSICEERANEHRPDEASQLLFLPYLKLNARIVDPAATPMYCTRSTV